MTNINPFAFFLGYFFGGDDQNNGDINLQDVNIPKNEKILAEARYVQNPSSFQWDKTDFVDKMKSIHYKYSQTTLSYSDKKAWDAITRLSENNSISTDEWIYFAEKILSK